MEREKSIYIIGAGIAGLTAAIELEKRGYSPTFIEESDRVGGKLKTDLINGYYLDHGFQVLLTAYPEARKYLDYDKLGLRAFEPGAIIYRGDKVIEIGDPLRNFTKIPKMMFSPVGNASDKLKIFVLTQKVKSRSLHHIFKGTRKSTIDYLSSKNFSYKIIEDFFKPFFGGIFLDKDLRTSSKMFQFVYKMLSSGNAAIPESGIQAIPLQLRDQLKHSTFRFNTRVKNISGNVISLDNGENIAAEKIIVATNPHTLIRGLWKQELNYNGVTNLYFETNKSFIEKPMIGLVPGNDAIINNFHFQTAWINDEKKDKNLISATILGHRDITDELVRDASQELKRLSKDPNLEISFLKGYKITHALPKLKDLDYLVNASTSRLSDHVYLAGDYMLYPSLNAAMASGRLAAEAVASNL